MNIKQAKQEITNTLRAYLTKDELGNYLIPSVRQRPVLLMGPPGVGKTQIMEQIASETGVGLVSYTITHHTRQSAVGLPFIEKRTYGGREYSVTEYTMSEILSCVYQLMERTGLREGILFLDEINCVSETLAPMMLQFLQCKTFGNQKLPEGWLIVAAGNPPEYNKSVRDFDVVTLDRVKRIDVEADFGVWKEYARRRGLHGAVVSYLDIKKENFYRLENSVDGMRFATARGWEDLSELLYAYEKLGLAADRDVVGQYIQLPQVARDFAGYLELYRKYQKTYQVEAILSGTAPSVTALELGAAPFDEKLSVLGLLLSAALTELRDRLPEADAQTILDQLLWKRREKLRMAGEAGQLQKEERDLAQREIQILETYQSQLASRDAKEADAVMELVRGWFSQEVDRREQLGGQCGEYFDNAFRFLEQALGQSQELVIFVTEITAGYDTSWFVENFGCDAYFRHNKELLFDDRRRQIRADIAAAKAAQQEEEQHHA